MEVGSSLARILGSTSCGLKLQVEINNFLKGQISGSNNDTFIIWLQASEHKQEGIIQVVGNVILPQEIQFAVPPKEELLTAIKDKRSKESLQLDETLRPLLINFISPFPNKIEKFPVFDPEDHDKLSFIVCSMNCTDVLSFEQHQEVFLIIRGILIATFQLSQERRRKEQCQALLAIAKNLFLHLGDLVDLMQEIILEARKLTGAERCSLFLVSDDGTELVAKVFDGVPREHAEEVRMPINQGVAGHVATTGQTLNIQDPYKHPLFYKKLDEMTGFVTKNILCFPIRDGQDRVVGVAQLCNKPTIFTTLDEEAATSLATYCGISLMHSLVYKKIQQSQARSRLANELLMYHMAATEESVATVTDCTHSHDLEVMLDWRWPCREASPEETPCLALAMFEMLGFLKSCRMKRSTVARFILLVKKGYRDMPYHNWMHAFSTAHFTFCVMKQLDLVGKSWITELEGVALLVAAFCHDLDHRGTTNSFQTKSKNTIACLYSSEGSIMERHHFAQALCILNTEGCNVFENLDTVAYRRVLDVMRDVILATDLAQHLMHLSQQQAIAGSYNPETREHREHLLRLLVTSADLCDQVKGWSYTRQIANLIYAEFFAQGDLEKAMGAQPAVMMDRDLADIPSLQVQFLVDICLPCYKTLVKFFPPLNPIVGAVEDSLRRWEMSKQWFDRPEHQGMYAIDLLNDSGLEAFIYEKQ